MSEYVHAMKDWLVKVDNRGPIEVLPRFGRPSTVVNLISVNVVWLKKLG